MKGEYLIVWLLDKFIKNIVNIYNKKNIKDIFSFVFASEIAINLCINAKVCFCIKNWYLKINYKKIIYKLI